MSHARSLMVLCAALLATSLAAAGPAQADPPTAADAVDVAAPFVGPAGEGGLHSLRAATDPLATAVADACNGGSAIYETAWWRFAPEVATTVIARSYTVIELGRSKLPVDSGLALVDVGTGAVLECVAAGDMPQSTSRTVQPTAPVYAVQYFPAAYDPEEILDYGWFRSFALVETTGVVPSNDDWQTPTPITALPFEDTVDASLTTSQPEDFAMGLVGCDFSPSAGWETIRRTAWWSFTPASTGVLDVTVENAPWAAEAVVIAAELTPDGPVYLPYCSEPGVEDPRAENVFDAGKTYLLQVGTLIPYYSSDSIDAGGPTTIRVSGDIALAGAPELVVEIDPEAMWGVRARTFTLTGDVTCSGGPLLASSIDGLVTQARGRRVAQVAFTVPGFACTGEPERWSATVSLTDLRPVFLQVGVRAEATNAVGTSTDVDEQRVRLTTVRPSRVS